MTQRQSMFAIFQPLAITAGVCKMALPLLALLLPLSAGASDSLREVAQKHFSPLPNLLERNQAQAAQSLSENNAALVHLGKTLFNERILSLDGEMTCNHCHRMVNGAGYFRRPAVDTGASGEPASFNTLPALNLSQAQYFGWRGASSSLEDFLAEHLLSPGAMAMNRAEGLVKRLSVNPSYDVAFSVAFKNTPPTADQSNNPGIQVSYPRIVQALAEYLRTVGSEDSFDRYLNGQDALSEAQRNGLNLFIEQGCVACHKGSLLGTQVLVDQETAAIVDDESGNDSITTLRVPSLRNVAVTGPYGHDGSIDSLDAAIRHWQQDEAGALNDQQVRQIRAFLNALTDSKQL